MRRERSSRRLQARNGRSVKPLPYLTMRAGHPSDRRLSVRQVEGGRLSEAGKRHTSTASASGQNLTLVRETAPAGGYCRRGCRSLSCHDSNWSGLVAASIEFALVQLIGGVICRRWPVQAFVTATGIGIARMLAAVIPVAVRSAAPPLVRMKSRPAPATSTMFEPRWVSTLPSDRRHDRAAPLRETRLSWLRRYSSHLRKYRVQVVQNK